MIPASLPRLRECTSLLALLKPGGESCLGANVQGFVGVRRDAPKQHGAGPNGTPAERNLAAIPGHPAPATYVHHRTGADADWSRDAALHGVDNARGAALLDLMPGPEPRSRSSVRPAPETARCRHRRPPYLQLTNKIGFGERRARRCLDIVGQDAGARHGGRGRAQRRTGQSRADRSR